MLRVIHEFKPKWVIAENVRGILTIEGGMVFEQVCLDLEREGYEVQPFIIPAVAVNAPHRRDRVWIVANPGQERAERIIEPALSWISGFQGSENVGRAADWARRPDISASGLCRGSDGFPNRVDRTGALGNAVVPQIPELIGNAILAAIQSRSALSAAGAGVTSFSPANSPAVTQGGGLCVSILSHEVTYGE
jgi:DNA (cytosine-5)-methyltransferase 1